MQPSASGSWLRALCRVPRHQTQENIVNDTTAPHSDLLTPPDRPASDRTPTPSDEIARLAADALGTSAARAEAILSTVGGLPGLAYASETELLRASVPKRRVRMIRAAFELARASVGCRPQLGQRLAGAFEVWTHMRARLAGRPVEEFWVIAVDVRHRVVLDRMLARGSLTGVEVHPRDVFRPLISSGAAAAIFCHNHPSGDPSPSRQDIELTTRLREVGEMCGIAVLDHVVVGWEGYVSLAERNWR
jgi:DNA repair protein RadC